MKRQRNRRPTPAFTLVELLIVIVIIGILVAFILLAAQDGIRRAEERATQALITKLESALNDRIDALLTQRPDPTALGDALIAQIVTSVPNTLLSPARAQVIANYQLMRRELPDVWFVPSLAAEINPDYAVNFGIAAFPPNSAPTALNFVLPFGAAGISTGLGMSGASWSVASGFYKQVSTIPQGFDMVDNNGNGEIDEAAESGVTTTSFPTHTHKTARAEMLYAILVEGQGPLGSAFDKDDFTNAEVKDTDGDGLLEFVDAWGEPLQFFRWPIFFASDVQKGSGLYNGAIEPRQLDPLDPNQQLMAPAWWSSTPNQSTVGGNFAASGNLSASAVAFQTYFTSLVDPNFGSGATAGTLWDRSGPTGTFSQRRAFYSKFLILSGGPDKKPGVAILDETQVTLSVSLLMQEGFGFANTPAVLKSAFGYSATAANDQGDVESAADDISNQNINSAGGIL